MQAADIAEILISGQIKEISAHGYLVDMASQTGARNDEKKYSGIRSKKIWI